MIETSTSWEDSGFDCKYCGGEVFKRTDRETGRPARSCFQCKQCGCQWTLDGDLLREGNGPAWEAAKKAGQTAVSSDQSFWQKNMLWLIVGFIGLLVLLRFFPVLLRLAVPVLIVAGLGWLIYRFIERQTR